MNKMNKMNKIIDQIEKGVVIGLLGLMLIVVVAGAIELVFVVFEAMIDPPRYLLLDINELLDIFGFFLLVLIGLELLASIKTYLQDNIIHVEIVMVVALIAVSRKIIVIDYEKIDPISVIGIAVLVIALSSGYYVMKRSHDK
jgi:uncharacterized membrane protein (DUF373 family)